MSRQPRVHTCAPPPIPSHLSVLWAFDQARLRRRGVDGAVPRDQWPEMLQDLGVIAPPPPRDPYRIMELETICYDLQERGWLPMLARLYKRGIWNGCANAPRYERFKQLWLQQWRTTASSWRAIGLQTYHDNPLPEYGARRGNRFSL